MGGRGPGHQPLLPRDNVRLSSSGCSEHEANNPQSGQQGPGAPCEQDDPGDRAEAGGVQPADEEQKQEEDLQVPEDPGDAGAGGAAGQVEIIQGARGAVPGPGGVPVPYQQVQSEAGAQHSSREELNI